MRELREERKVQTSKKIKKTERNLIRVIATVVGNRWKETIIPSVDHILFR